jgi:hypothetical protein
MTAAPLPALRAALTDQAFSALVAFCRANLKPAYDPETYARGFDKDLGVPGQFGAVTFEIRAFHTITGHPATLSFNDDSDFREEWFD